MTKLRTEAMLALAIALTSGAGIGPGVVSGVVPGVGTGVGHAQTMAQASGGRAGARESSITVRPWTLAAFADELAGQAVTLPRARVVHVIDPRVFVVESETPLRSMIDHHRVVVFLESGTFQTDPEWKDARLTIVGVARSLRGMQAARGAFWPAALTRDEVKRLHIRAAILARSVQTPEGIELVSPASAALTHAPQSSPDR